DRLARDPDAPPRRRGALAGLGRSGARLPRDVHAPRRLSNAGQLDVHRSDVDPGLGVRLELLRLGLGGPLLHPGAGRRLARRAPRADHEPARVQELPRPPDARRQPDHGRRRRGPGGHPLVRAAPERHGALSQEGTYSPDATRRWHGSIAMARQGDIALGYSASSGTVSPSIRYTG